MQKLLSFNDVIIIPQYSTVKSRANVSLSTSLGAEKYAVPLMSANMDTITDVEMALAMERLGAAAALHRFMSVEGSVVAFRKAPNAWMSIGVGIEEERRFIALRESGCSNFLIDVAHAANENVTNLIKKMSTENVQLIVGNFAGQADLAEFLKVTPTSNIVAVKIGVGSGSVCSTRVITGCGIPTLSAVGGAVRALESHPHIKIIADGGIRGSGEAAKALAAGADMVMVGSLLAGTTETPGNLVYPESDGPTCAMKSYRGSASLSSYVDQGKVAGHRVAEGENTLVRFKGGVEQVIVDFVAGVKSAFSYVGAHTLDEFQARANLAEISNNGYIEGTPFGAKK